MPRHWVAPDGLFADTDDVAGVFATIYARNVWGDGSGIGSDPRVARAYLEFVERFVADNRIGRVVDLGCGDWRFSRLIDWGRASYHGIDVVPSVVQANVARFTAPGIEFSRGDPLEDGFRLPDGDLLLIKDVLQHLTNENVRRLLALTRRFEFCLVTNDHAPVNRDCRNGDTRPLDIRAEPFGVERAAIVLTFGGKATFLVMNSDREPEADREPGGARPPAGA